MAIQSNFPAIRPSLLLDFANSKRLDPRITFTRASTARYYDGSTVAKAEENLVTQSAAFDDAAWTKNRTSVTADQTTAPDGTSTADLLAATADSGTHSCSRNSNVEIISGATYTFSVYLKKGTGATAPDWMQLTFTNAYFAATQYANFNLTTGVVGTVGAGGTASIVDAGSGWYRCIYTATATSGSTATSGPVIGFTNNNDGLGRLPSYVDATTSDVFVWGAQLEQRSAVTAYTATTTQAITNYVPQLLTAQNNVPRFDHNPTTGESLGLLIEEQRTNSLTYSEDFSNVAWTKSNASILTAQNTAPDGTLTAQILDEGTAASVQHGVTQNTTLVISQPYVFSAYVKNINGQYLTLVVRRTTSASRLCRFDLVNVTATVTGTGTGFGTGAGGTGSITSVGNGWYRVEFLWTFSSGPSSPSVSIGMWDGASSTFNSATGLYEYTATGRQMFIWGAQVEAGAFATSYIPTTAASATRQADAASMTGTNFSSWYDAAEGTLYGEFTPLVLNGGAGVAFNDNTTTNRIRLSMNSTSDQGSVLAGGVSQALLDGGTPAVGTTQRIAMAYKVNDFALSLAGGSVATDTSGTIPVVSQANIGASLTTIGSVQIKKFAYYPLRVTDAQLQAITG